MSNLLEEQYPSKRRRINSAQQSEPAEQLNAEAISYSKEKKDSALDINVLFSLPNLPAIALLAPAAAIRRVTLPHIPSPKRPFRWNHKFRPVPKSDEKDPPTPEINPFDASITYPERLNLTQKLFDQALKTARAETKEQKKVNEGLKKEYDQVKKETVEVKRQLVEFMAQQALRDGDHAALVKATAVSQDLGRPF